MSTYLHILPKDLKLVTHYCRNHALTCAIGNSISLLTSYWIHATSQEEALNNARDIYKKIVCPGIEFGIICESRFIYSSATYYAYIKLQSPHLLMLTHVVEIFNNIDKPGSSYSKYMEIGTLNSLLKGLGYTERLIELHTNEGTKIKLVFNAESLKFPPLYCAL